MRPPQPNQQVINHEIAQFAVLIAYLVLTSMTQTAKPTPSATAPETLHMSAGDNWASFFN